MVKIIGDYGFCFGVENAIRILKEAKSENNKTILFHPLIHNISLNKKLMKENKAFFYNEVDFNENDIILFSAHGHTIEEENKYKNYNIKDATCPLILNRYKQIEENYKSNINYYFVGKKNHQETISFLSHFPYLNLIDISDLENALYSLNLTINKQTFLIPQTTISSNLYINIVHYFKKNSNLQGYLNICNLYYKRILDAIKVLDLVDYKNSYLIVCGDFMSSNANEILNTLLEKYPLLNGKIALTIDKLNVNEYRNKDVYIVSSTSVSKEEVLSLKENIENLI